MFLLEAGEPLGLGLLAFFALALGTGTLFGFAPFTLGLLGGLTGDATFLVAGEPFGLAPFLLC